MKKCKKCGRVQDLSCFYKQQSTADGHRHYCKDCWKNLNKIGKEKNGVSYFKNRKKKLNILKSRYGIGAGTICRFGFKLSLEVYEKANRKCELCGNENDLTIHHIDGQGRHNAEKGLPVNNDIFNLQILCRSCHGRLHALKHWENKVLKKGGKNNETGN